MNMVPQGVIVYNRRQKKVQYVNQFVQELFQGKKTEVKITEKNADSLLKMVKMKYKAYGEEEKDVQNQEEVPKTKIFDFA